MAVDSPAPPPLRALFPTYSGEGLWPCVFCGGFCEVGRVDGRRLAVLHEKPTCAEFDRMAPDEFVHACFQIRVTHGGN